VTLLAAVAVMAVLAQMLTGLGSITGDLASARIYAQQTANGQRDLLMFHTAVNRLAFGGDRADAELRRGLALQQLTVLEEHAADLPEAGGAGTLRRLRGHKARLRAVRLDRLGGGPGRRAAMAAADRRLSAMERDFKGFYDENDLEFHELIRSALSARGDAQMVLGALVLLTLAMAGLWGAQAFRRSRGHIRAARAQVLTSEERFRSMVQNSSDLTLLTDGAGRVRYASPAVLQLTGVLPEEVLGRRLELLVHHDDRAPLVAALGHLTAGAVGRTRLEFRLVHADGSTRDVDVTASNMLGDPAVGAVVLNARDVTDNRRLEAELGHLAFHDPLTGLPNRALLRERVEHAAARASRDPGMGMALVLIDLDDFKAVNDSLGHEVGDRLLTGVARRLTEVVRPGDTVARLGGDEFVVFTEAIPDEAEAVDLAERLLEALADPVDVGLDLPPVGASLGVRFAEAHEGAAPEVLMRDADLAMYAAKDGGKNHWAMFEPAMHHTAAAELALRADLHRALENDELVLRYEPIVDLRTGVISGFEALARWQHPEHGLLSPDRFIGLAEDSGLIEALGAWVIREATRTARRLQEASGRHDLRMGVNLSPRQLDRLSITGTVARALEQTGLPPDRLVLEVTEGVFLAETAVVSACLDGLRGLGVKLALDDFGTGFSSLGYLERLPLDVLKIDRSFVLTLTSHETRGVLVETIVRLADVLGLVTIAEGVETVEQLEALRALGCRQVQGYLFSRPMTEADALRMLRRGPIVPQGAAHLAA
jgi:diguanylate cyclase (GGDEF)-like protein/PAS domain S-box-containing protein